MKEIKPDKAIRDVQSYNEQRSARAEDSLDYFLEKQNSLIKRVEVIDSLSEEYGWSEAQANVAIGDVVGDIVDPVQQVVHSERGKLVGIIEHNEYPDSGAYGYVDFDDVRGQRKRVVCSQCVTEAQTDVEVTHATEGEGTAPEDASWMELCTIVEDHYETEHDVEPSSVEVGASLASGTTISGNTSFHVGNDGIGSGLDADSVDGKDPGDIGRSDSEIRNAVDTLSSELRGSAIASANSLITVQHGLGGERIVVNWGTSVEGAGGVDVFEFRNGDFVRFDNRSDNDCIVFYEVLQK